MVIKSVITCVGLAIFLLIGGVPSSLARTPARSFAPSLLNVEQLPRFRPVSKVGFFSSYDRKGGNDDGFSGKSFIRKEGDGLVIAEVKGRGAITRFWATDPLPDAPVEFYFDGESTPRLSLPIKTFFRGETSPFLWPLAGHHLGGYFSLVPLEFARSIKIVVRAPVFHFYQINYVLYEPQVPTRTFTPGDTVAVPEPRIEGTRVTHEQRLAPGETLTVFESHRPGRIQSLKLGPARAFAGKQRDIVLRIFWDDASRPAVEVPVGDFFGYSFGEPAMRSLLIGTEDDWNYVYFPMPFAKTARIEIDSQRQSGPPLEIRSEVVVSDRAKSSDEGTFHASWHRENPTTIGRPFTYLDIQGRGHLVTAMLQAQGSEPGQTYFFEGDEGAFIDGRLAFAGTGSEDSFNGSWYGVPARWYGRQSLPFSGCLDYDEPLARTGGYRLYLGDAYVFKKSLRFTIEHGGEGNTDITDYVGTTFFYLDGPEGITALPPAAARAVIDPSHFVLNFQLGPPPPIEALKGSAIEPGWVQVVSGSSSEKVSFLSFKRTYLSGLGAIPTDLQNAPDFFPLPGSQSFEGLLGPPTLMFRVNVPRDGLYEISAEAVKGPTAAILQLRVNDQPVGTAVDFYAPTTSRSGWQKLSQLHLSQGPNLLVLTLPAKNSKSSGTGVDLIRVQGTRLN